MALRTEVGEESYEALVAQYESKKRLDLTGEAVVLGIFDEFRASELPAGLSAPRSSIAY